MALTLTAVVLSGHIFMIIAAPIISSYDQEISAVIHRYNEMSGKENLFKLFKVGNENRTILTDESAARISLRFSMKETTCKKSDLTHPANCAFMPGGVVMNCELVIDQDRNTEHVTQLCKTAFPTRYNKRPFRRDLSEKNQGNNDSSLDIKKSHKQECLECILTLFPK